MKVKWGKNVKLCLFVLCINKIFNLAEFFGLVVLDVNFLIVNKIF